MTSYTKDSELNLIVLLYGGLIEPNVVKASKGFVEINQINLYPAMLPKGINGERIKSMVIWEVDNSKIN